MNLVLRLALNTLAVWLAVSLLSGLDFDGEWWALVIIAAVLGVLNAVVKPIVKLLSLPFIILTLGLFLLVINAVLLAIVIAISGATDLGLTSTGFVATFLGAVVISVVSFLGELFTGLD